MLDSYFFIPANKPHFINGISKLKSDFFIFDLEDTVPDSEIKNALANITPFKCEQNIFVRPPLFKGDKLDLEVLDQLYNLGFKQYVLPKLENYDQIQLIKSRIPNSINTILLVEHPSLILDLKEILHVYKNWILGIGFGSHDYCMFSGLKQNQVNMNLVRFQLNQFTKKFNLRFIDTASMNINDMLNFEEECINAFSMGCDGKFLIHPKQLNTIRSTKYFSDDDINWGIKAYELIKNLNYEEISAYNVDGMVLEKPHIKKINQIIKYLELK